MTLDDDPAGGASTAPGSGLTSRSRVEDPLGQPVHGDFPPRYAQSWYGPFDAAVKPLLKDGVRILDVGAGRIPTIAPEQRPTGCRYVGLDASGQELRSAPPGAYDDFIVSDVTTKVPALCAQFDLVLSWQVLEHVKPLRQALENLRAYLCPSGCLAAVLSGKFSMFALANLALPASLAARLVARVMRRDPASVFPAHYDGCYYSRLREMLRPWSSAEITPRYSGASYLHFSRRIQSVYLRYENWAAGNDHPNLATHYFILATR